MVRQSLSTGSGAFGGIGFSAIDDSNNSGQYDAARIAIVNETPSAVASPTAMAFYTQAGGVPSNPATERARINSSGDLLVGTTTNSYGVAGRLTVAGGITSINGALNVAGSGGFYNGANKFGIDNNAGASRFYSSGANSSTRGSYEFHITDSTGALDTIAAYIDTSGNLGIGTSSPTAKLDISSTSTADTIGIRRSSNSTNGMLKFTTAGTDDWILGERNTTDSNFHLYSYGTSSDVVTVLRSNGYVGIGTSSPLSKLDISLTGTASIATTTITKVTDFAATASFGFNGLSNNNDGVYFGMGAGGGNGIPAGIGFMREASGWNTAIAFYTNNVTSGPNSTNAIQEKVRIDSNGNLNLGVTTNSFDNTAYTTIQLPNGGSVAGYKGSAYPIMSIGSNWAYNSGDKYIIGGSASLYAQAGGAHNWSTAGNGTAGSAMTLSTQMVLSNSGNLSVGGTGSKARLHVQGGSAAFALESFKPNDGFARSIEVCYGQSGNYNTLTIEADLNGPGGWCYELNTGGTSGGYTSTGGGYINGSANFSHVVHTSGGSSGASLTVSCPSGNIVRFVLTGGSGVHPVCTFKITGSLNQDFSSSNITVVYS
jgi:hypothetical protein